MKNVINKLKTPANRYQNQEFINKYTLSISEPAFRQKIGNFKYLSNEAHQPIYVLNNKRFSIQNQNLPIIGRSKDTKKNNKIQHIGEILPKSDWNAHLKTQKSLDSKQNSMNETTSLKNRANQFIKKVNEQKSKLKGRFFFLKQQQLERKNIKQQIESLQKTYMKFHYQSKRRSRAYANIQHLTQKAKQRQKESNSKSHFRLKSQLPNRQGKKKSSLVFYKQDQLYQSKASKVQSRNRIIKTQGDQQQASTYSLNQQDANDIQLVRKKLILLNNLMKKEDQYKQKPAHIY